LIEAKYAYNKKRSEQNQGTQERDPIYGELSTSESKEKESYKRLVIDLKMELKSLEEKIKK